MTGIPATRAHELRVAVTGADDAILHHIGLWQRIPGVHVAAFCDADRERLLQAVDLAPGAAAFTSNESLLTSGLFSALDICAPTAEYTALVETALAAGFDVLCRAPVSGDQAAARAFAAVTLREGQVFLPVPSLRFHPAIAFLRDMVENDDLGGALHIQVSVSAEQTPAIGESLDAAAIAGIDLFAWLTGHIGSARSAIGAASGFPDAAAIAITSCHGAVGSILATCGRPMAGTSVAVSGSAGAADAVVGTGLVRFRTAESPVWLTHDAGVGDPDEAAIRHFAACIHSHSQPLCTARDAATAAAVWAAVCARPVASGGWTTLPDGYNSASYR
ncbi:MAG: Gfo/Idh/MocA family oxidoreductase [Armatimonadetes bacterium]|nr:Gfo/Idh/MocA family oxidoreductase [Armatimonadota bacterium]MDE2205532.1 Gfo/Idh/MocA family oxidoreductase [Armatimonadota bacterium]